MNKVVLALLLWIGQNSAYDTSKIAPPQIVELSPQEITDEAYFEMPHMKPKDGVDERIWALYNFEQGPYGTIYVLDAKYSVDEVVSEQSPRSNPIFQERLLHELVHHVQRLSGAYDTYPCRNFGELEAYELGGAFLKQHDARDPLPNRSHWARVFSRC